AAMQTKIRDVLVSIGIEFARHNRKMFFRGRVDIDENRIVFAQELERFLQLLAYHPVSVPQFNRNRKIAGHSQNVLELVELMLTGRKCRRQLQQQDAKLSGAPKNS